MKGKNYDAVAYALKVWFTTLILATFNYFGIIIYLLPQARILTFVEGLKHSFWVWIAGLWGYFPTLLFFLAMQNFLRNRLRKSAGARNWLVFSGALFTGLNVFIAGTLAGFPGLIWCHALSCQLAFTATFCSVFVLAAVYFMPWD
ncbi:MAG TPA: hypothetical protein VK927_04355 [Adhaeribacter sp.]|nr:hypothetical protein [Adhaeribacter sp.]